MGHTKSGMMRVTVPLPPVLILEWVANGGAANYGFLLR